MPYCDRLYKGTDDSNNADFNVGYLLDSSGIIRLHNKYSSTKHDITDLLVEPKISPIPNGSRTSIVPIVAVEAPALVPPVVLLPPPPPCDDDNAPPLLLRVAPIFGVPLMSGVNTDRSLCLDGRSLAHRSQKSLKVDFTPSWHNTQNPTGVPDDERDTRSTWVM